MSLQLDHIVIAVHDLAQASADYTALGFTVVPGGEHPGRTTHNALVVFADGAYFELIAWRAPAPDERWWQLLQQHGEGIVDVALLPADTGTTVADAAARGLAYSGPHDGGRLRPDGERLQWQTARPPSADLPFLCGDRTPRALRVPEGALRTHANGATGVASLAIAVQDVAASLARWRALLGPQAALQQAPWPGSGTDHGTVVLGNARIVLVAPREPQASARLAQRLADRGAGPYALVLASSDPAVVGTAADTRRTHGAVIEFGKPLG